MIKPVAESLLISKLLNTAGLSTEQIVFQLYDYTNSMSGEHQKVQQKISEMTRRNIRYIPCQAHRRCRKEEGVIS